MADMMIPEGWKKASLGELCKFSGGSAFKEKYQGKTQGDYPFIKVSDMNLEGNQRFIINANHWIDQNIRLEAKIKLFPASAIVFAKVGAALLLNRRRILIRETAIDNNMMAAIPLEDDNNFLYYILQEIDLGEIVQEGAVPSVNQAQMEEIPVLIPPLPEQQKIATILTSVDTVIEKTRAQIDKLKHLKTGMMQQLLTQGIGHTEFKNTPVGRIPKTWEVKTLGDLIKSMVGGVSVNGENREKSLNEIGVLKVSSVFKGQFLPQEHKAVVPEDVSRVRLNPKKDHILFSRANTPLLVGESAYIDKDYHDLFLPDKLWMIDVKDRRQVNVKWLSYILCSEQVRSAITDAATGSSSTMKNISKPSLLGISIALPPIFEQKKISDMLQSVDEKTIVAIQKLKNLTKIKKALMQDLLTGKVRVQSLKKL